MSTPDSDEGNGWDEGQAALEAAMIEQSGERQSVVTFSPTPDKWRGAAVLLLQNAHDRLGELIRQMSASPVDHAAVAQALVTYWQSHDAATSAMTGYWQVSDCEGSA
jgi:hypothetical protein